MGLPLGCLIVTLRVPRSECTQRSLLSYDTATRVIIMQFM